MNGGSLFFLKACQLSGLQACQQKILISKLASWIACQLK
jgi:hypothetical protein